VAQRAPATLFVVVKKLGRVFGGRFVSMEVSVGWPEARPLIFPHCNL